MKREFVSIFSISRSKETARREANMEQKEKDDRVTHIVKISEISEDKLIQRYKEDLVVREVEVRIKVDGKIHTHLFRHGFAVNFLKQSHNIVALKELLGHTSIMRTMIYLRLAQRDLKETMDRVDFYV